MPEAGHRDAGEEIEILVAVGVDQAATTPFGNRQLGERRDALQARGDVPRLLAVQSP